MIIWTHRGFPNQENTLSAFEAAYEAGIRHFETDIHATLDGELILSHDVGTNRLIEEDFHIPSMNFSEMVRLTGNRYQWCRLVDLLDKYDDVKISIDVKHSFAVEPLIKLLRQRNTDNLIICGEIDSISITKTKTGKNPGSEMAFISMSDSYGCIDSVIFFPEAYKNHRNILFENNVIIVKGKKSNSGDSLLVEKAYIPRT